MSSSAWLALITLFTVVGLVTVMIWIMNKVIGAIAILALFFIEPVQLESIDRIYSIIGEMQR